METRNKPFDPNLVKRAGALAARYHISVKQDKSGYIGTVTKMPSVIGCGTSKADALSATRDLLKWALAYLIENGRNPAPKSG